MEENKIISEEERQAHYEKEGDVTGLTIFKFRQLEKKVEELLSGLIRVEKNKSLMPDWINKAKAAGFNGSDSQIIERVKNWDAVSSGIFRGKHFPGIFVNASGALINFKQELSPVYDVVLKMTAETGKKVFIITDDESPWLDRILADNKIIWPVVSKSEMLGARLDTVIDNVNQDEFEETYMILVNEFIEVDSIY